MKKKVAGASVTSWQADDNWQKPFQKKYVESIERDGNLQSSSHSLSFIQNAFIQLLCVHRKTPADDYDGLSP